MKKASLSLIVLLMAGHIISLGAALNQKTSRLKDEKRSLSQSMKAYWKCIKRDKDCDPEKQKVVNAAKAILITVGIVGGYALVQYLASSTDKLEEEKGEANLALIQALSNIDKGTGTWDTANQAIEKGANLNSMKRSHLRLLDKAKTKELITFLAKKFKEYYGGFEEPYNQFGELILVDSVKSCDVAKAEILFNYGAKMDIKSAAGRTLLMEALLRTMTSSPQPKCYEMVRVLLERGADIDETATTNTGNERSTKDFIKFQKQKDNLIEEFEKIEDEAIQTKAIEWVQSIKITR